MENLIEYLNSKFESYRANEWHVHNWQNFGADYGFVLKLKGHVFILETFTDSGYALSESTILETSDTTVILQLIDHLCPTNSNYKTD